MSTYNLENINHKKLVQNIVHLFAENKNPNFLFLTNSINSTDISLKPIIDIIREKKPKITFYHLPTECLTNWLIPHKYNDTSFIPPDFFILDKLLDEIGGKFYAVLGGQNTFLFDLYKDELTPLKNFRIKYWPTYNITHTWGNLWDFYVGAYHHYNGNYKSVADLKVKKEFQHLYINYNNRARYHRCMTMDYLCQTNLFEYGLNSWNTFSYEGGNLHDVDQGYESYDFKCWTEKLINIDNYVTVLTDKPIAEENKEYAGFWCTKSLLEPNALFSLITETSANTNYITEKTYRALFLEHPFIVIGGKNQNLELLNLGFELYDEIFDYTFDSSNDLKTRVKGAIDNLAKFKDSNYLELYNLLEPKIKRNKKRIVDIFLDDPLNPYNEFVDFSDPNFNKIKDF